MKAFWTVIVLLLALLCVPVNAQSQHHEAPPAVHGDMTSDMQIYAMLEAPPPATTGSARFLQRFTGISNPRFGGRPMLLWHHWANQRKRFFPSLFFLLFWTILISSCAPRWINNSQLQCKTHFWRTFLYGLLAVTIGATAVRASLLSMIGWSLAVVSMGVLQLALVGGATVLVLLIGQAFSHYLRMDKWIVRPDARRLAQIVIGCIVFALLLQIPGIGTLPRIGTRLIGLLAMVGLGGLLRARRFQSETVQ